MLDEFLTSERTEMRLARSIVQGLLSVAIVAVPLVMGGVVEDPTWASVATAAIMCVHDAHGQPRGRPRGRHRRGRRRGGVAVADELTKEGEEALESSLVEGVDTDGDGNPDNLEDGDL